MPLVSRDVLVGRLPPASRPSSWDVCRAICKLGAAQTRRAAGLELHGEGAARDRRGGCSPPAPAGSAGGRLCWAPSNCGVQLPWDGPALALTCSWGPTFWTQGSGRAGGAAVAPHRVGPDLQAPALTPQGCCRLSSPLKGHARLSPAVPTTPVRVGQGPCPATWGTAKGTGLAPGHPCTHATSWVSPHRCWAPAADSRHRGAAPRHSSRVGSRPQPCPTPTSGAALSWRCLPSPRASPRSRAASPEVQGRARGGRAPCLWQPPLARRKLSGKQKEGSEEAAAG